MLHKFYSTKKIIEINAKCVFYRNNNSACILPTWKTSEGVLPAWKLQLWPNLKDSGRAVQWIVGHFSCVVPCEDNVIGGNNTVPNNTYYTVDTNYICQVRTIFALLCTKKWNMSKLLNLYFERPYSGSICYIDLKEVIIFRKVSFGSFIQKYIKRKPHSDHISQYFKPQYSLFDPYKMYFIRT